MSPTQTAGDRQIRSLTGMRFFAALWVVVLHFATHQHTKNGPPLIHNLFSHGQLGVAMFFVLSGFVLGYTYLAKATAGRLDKPSFYVARFARIYPVFMLASIAFIPFAWRFVRATHDLNESISLMGQSFVLQAALLQTWFPNVLYATNWNTPSWSISVEAFFYLTFPALAAFFGGNGFRANVAWALGLLAVLALTRMWYWQGDPDGLNGADANVTKDFVAGLFFYNPLFRVVEFTLGIILVVEFLRHRDAIANWKPSLPNAGFFLTAVAGVALWSFPHSTAATTWAYPATVLVLSSIIFWVAIERVGWLSAFLGSAPLLLLGEASYSMYMLQRPVAEYMNWIGQKMGWGSVEYNFGYFWVFLVVLTLVSIAAYYVVERPLRKWIRAKFEARRARQRA